MTKQVYESNSKGRRAAGRLCTRLLYGVKNGCSARPLKLRDGKMKCLFGEHWGDSVNGRSDVMKV